jgi:vancomycin permeability regulator SanA
LRQICFLVALLLIAVGLPAVWVVCDGLRDAYNHADAAFVPGYAESRDGVLAPGLIARLDRAAELYDQGVFPAIVVSGATPLNEKDESNAMAQYLEAHQVPAGVITEDHRGEKAGDSMENLANIMKNQGFHSVLIIADYYRLTRMKVALRQEGISEFQQAHVGQWKKEDATKVLNEVAIMYDSESRRYLLPVVEKIVEKVKALSGSPTGWKDAVNHWLDSMSK